MVRLVRDPMSRTGRTWKKLTLAGTQWRVKLVPAGAKELEGALGLCDSDQATIYLNRDLPESLLRTTLMHEILHALLSTPGEVSLMARIFGCKESEVNQREEEFVTHIAPKLIDALTVNFRFQMGKFR